MIRYRPRHLWIALHLLIVAINLLVGAYLASSAFTELGRMRLFLWGASGFLVLIAYIHVAPLIAWPCAIAIDREHGTITFCYLLYKRAIPINEIIGCSVCEALNRYSYTTYILAVKKGPPFVLSELIIAQFPGPFAYNIGVEVTERLPRFIPGFRQLSHSRK